MTDIIFIPRSIEEKPEKEGFYFTLYSDGRNGNNWFKDGKWLDEILSGNPTEITHWLKETDRKEYIRQIEESMVSIDALQRLIAGMKKKNFREFAILEEVEKYLNEPELLHKIFRY